MQGGARGKQFAVRLLRNLFRKVDDLLSGRRPVDEQLFEELEEALVQADLNVNTVVRIVEDLRRVSREDRMSEAEQIRERLRDEIAQAMSGPDVGLQFSVEPPTVYLVVGVNGVGKTTSIAKLAHRFKREGKRVILAAADTFRAAAIDQLEIWANRVGVDLIRQREGADPAAVVYDAIQAARSRRADLVIADTAGRLHTRSNLMEELRKIGRVIEREVGRKADEVLLVLDATTGQNAISQAREFAAAVGVTGIVLAKLDGTAKGGIVVTLNDELGIPIKLVGTGETLDDLEDFDSADFAASLVG
ncbi:MAG: signal recognition particle-docking protein FtsY [Armatimonadetes bacterium]|nr:signal recognition particle-docking protein FtsY [Armatimonadota bacterium]